MSALAIVLCSVAVSVLAGAAAGWWIAGWAIRFHEAGLLRRIEACEALCAGQGQAQSRLKASIENAHVAVSRARADAARAKFLVDHAPRRIKRDEGGAA